jgi:hypothetical protein
VAGNSEVAPRVIAVLTPDEIRDLCLRKYAAFLRSIVLRQPFFPLPIRFGKPTTAVGFAQLRSEVEALAGSALPYRIEWREVRSSRLDVGRQRLPERLWFESEADFLTAIDKAREVAHFRKQLEEARTTCPGIVEWMARRSLIAVEHADVWQELLMVCAYFLRHPRPGCYPRELPLPIGTKFIGDHERILDEMLTAVLPSTSVEASGSTFEERFGLRAAEATIRLRMLDAAAVPAEWPQPLNDVAVPRSTFAELRLPARRALIVENKFTFLTLPSLTSTFALFGAGNAVALLAGIEVLRFQELWYWGDLDLAGFHILNRLRHHFPHVRSIFMDQGTLNEHRALAIYSDPPIDEEVDRLTEDERTAYMDIKLSKLRLEQEKLPHSWVVQRLRLIDQP